MFVALLRFLVELVIDEWSIDWVNRATSASRKAGMMKLYVAILRVLVLTTTTPFSMQIVPWHC